MTNVLIYSTPSCGYCKMAKEFFKENNIKYEEKDVAENEIAAQEMMDKSQQMGVPVIIIEKEGKENMVVGFDKKKLTELLEL